MFVIDGESFLSHHIQLLYFVGRAVEVESGSKGQVLPTFPPKTFKLQQLNFHCIGPICETIEVGSDALPISLFCAKQFQEILFTVKHSCGCSKLQSIKMCCMSHRCCIEKKKPLWLEGILSPPQFPFWLKPPSTFLQFPTLTTFNLSPI